MQLLVEKLLSPVQIALAIQRLFRLRQKSFLMLSPYGWLDQIGVELSIAATALYQISPDFSPRQSSESAHNS